MMKILRWVTGAFFTTPESVESFQPYRLSPASSLAIVFDGRLDNREELLKAVSNDARISPESSDQELVLRAYLLWEEKCVRKLDGEFAFAIWDNRKKQLFCARDRLGAKPFYYRWDGKCFVFSSEMAQLLQDSSYRAK